MIIPNGELWREEPRGEMEIDPETGYPSVREGGWSDVAIACQVVPLSMDLLCDRYLCVLVSGCKRAVYGRVLFACS